MLLILVNAYNTVHDFFQPIHLMMWRLSKQAVVDSRTDTADAFRYLTSADHATTLSLH